MSLHASEKLPHLADYDVIVIGAGIVGSMIARELCRLKGRFALLDKEVFPTFGVSKAGMSQIHLPDFCPEGSLKGKLSFDAVPRYRQLAGELDLPYREVDELWLALEPGHMANLEAAKKRGESHGATGYEIIGPERIKELEPHANEKALAALYGKGLCVIYVPEWGFAIVENAVQNGLHLHLQTTVDNIVAGDDGSYLVHTSKGTFGAKYLVNAAGLFADEIAWMVGDANLRLIPRKGMMVIFDKSASALLRNHILFGTFSEVHSQVLAPTVHGNLILGIHYEKPKHRGDSEVTREGIRKVMQLGKELVPGLSENDIITQFTGTLADNNMAPGGDFFIAPSERSPGIIHATVGAPGLTAAPAAADLVIKLLAEEGLTIEETGNFQKERIGWGRFSSASFEEREKMIAENPKYGHILCRCEHVSEAEMKEAIRRGASTMDAVKHITRAGMGRCQGGFCGTSTLKLLADQLGILPSQVTVGGEGSNPIVGFTKERSD
jgi:glycerol-3-phosphate dehydrogenase